MGEDVEQSTEELRAVQDERARTEAEQATESHDLEEMRTHQRRSDKAAYLREKLDEQAAADEDH